jgi:phenylacetate-CoA ligase
MGRFAGRGDNMVKLRGVNVWPEGVGAIATAVEGTAPDYFVRAVRIDGRDELRVAVVSEAPADSWVPIRMEVERRLQEQLGVRIQAVIVGPGQLDELTEVATSPKAKRFRDER